MNHLSNNSSATYFGNNLQTKWQTQLFLFSQNECDAN